jgi:hypothetical protein
MKVSAENTIWTSSFFTPFWTQPTYAFRLGDAAHARSLPARFTVKGKHDTAIMATNARWTTRLIRLTGTLGGVVIESTPALYTDQASGKFEARGFTFANAVAGASPVVVNVDHPFRAEGNWTWTISTHEVDGTAPLTSAAPTPTPFEMFVFPGEMDPIFGNRHWYEVIRLAVLDYAAAAGAGLARGPTQQRYLDNLVWRVWNGAVPWKVHYDSWESRSHFTYSEVVAGAMVRGYRLESLMKPPNTPEIRRVYCLDLALILQIGLKALGRGGVAAGALHANDLVRRH